MELISVGELAKQFAESRKTRLQKLEEECAAIATSETSLSRVSADQNKVDAIWNDYRSRKISRETVNAMVDDVWAARRTEKRALAERKKALKLRRRDILRERFEYAGVPADTRVPRK